MDKVTLVRSMHHTMKNHNSASYYALTGHAPPLDDIRLRDSRRALFPAYGSVVDALAPADRRHADVRRLSARDPRRLGHARPARQLPRQGARPAARDRRPERARLPPARAAACRPACRPSGCEDRREMQQLIDRPVAAARTTRPRPAGLDAYYERGAGDARPRRACGRRSTSRPSRGASATRYGRTTYGQSCLLARRLVEAGVKFVNVYFSDTIGGQSTSSGGWDTHGFNNTRMYPIIEKRHLPMTDQTLPTFLNDLDDRGLLDETLVVWMGEFGRTPKINEQHQPRPLAAVLHRAAGRRRREARLRLRRLATSTAPTPTATPCGPTTWRPRCSTCWASTLARRCATPRTDLC